MDVWIVGQVNPEDFKEWEFQGVFSTEELAIEACINSNFFIGKATVDVTIPIESIPWPGAYCPKQEASD